MDKYEYLWMCIRNNHLPGDISCDSGLTYEEIFKLSGTQLMECCNLTKKQAEYILNARKQADVDTAFERFKLSGINAVTIGDDAYPERLRFIENRPYALFYKGSLPDDERRSVAVIGARDCTEYGRLMAEEIASDLGKKGIVVISGMAYGVDGIAQAAALNGGGKSYGVLGSGVDICYPRSNRTLYERLIREGGVVSEYPDGVAARADNFPLRNRIISGLSDIVLVVEAKIKSGTFITVDYALSQGREIMVIPGRATDPLSVGCNALIFQGAIPAQSAGDVIRLLDSVAPKNYEQIRVKTDFRTLKLSEVVPRKAEKILLEREENEVYKVMDFYPKNAEEIQKSVKLNVVEVMGALIGLEMKGLIKENGKNSYVKCQRG